MKLLSPLKEALQLKNKVVMAPMTRSRATQDHIPTAIMATYYGQRASAGLIITEGTAPSPDGVGYARIPGIYNAAQIAGWKEITDAVHAKGGKMFMQLMHTGRISHPDNMPEGAKVMAPSPLSPKDTKMYVDGKGELEIPVPHEMNQSDIDVAVSEFVSAAENAIKAGFDGVELHAANGYLLEEFINPNANERTDKYGGAIENRTRIVLDIAEKTSAAIGADKVGIRLSPNGAFNGIGPFDGQKETFDYLAEKLSALGLVYVHLVNHESMGALPLPEDIRKSIREKFEGLLILSGGYDKESAEADLQENKGDLVAFGRPYVANPDLVERFEKDAELQDPKMDLLYTPGEEGYIDYPSL